KQLRIGPDSSGQRNPETPHSSGSATLHPDLSGPIRTHPELSGPKTSFSAAKVGFLSWRGRNLQLSAAICMYLHKNSAAHLPEPNLGPFQFRVFSVIGG